MAKAETMDESMVGTGVTTGVATAGSAGPVDVLVALTGPADALAVQEAGRRAATIFGSTLPNATLAIAQMDMGGEFSSGQAFHGQMADGQTARPVRLLSYKAPGNAGSMPWLPSNGTYLSLFSLARSSGARATVVVSADLAALEHDTASRLATPVLNGECELAMPLYAQSRFSGLINAGVLAPLTRALYGKRLRFPLALDFAVGPGLLPFFEHDGKRVQASGDSLFWPATEAAAHERKICQVHVDAHHEIVTEGDLTTVLSQVVGPLFNDIEVNAPVWQRVRGSHAVPTGGTPFAAPEETGKIDTRPMVESFQLASRNLQEVWSLVLPPVTQLELKRLTRLSPEQFHMPDALWVRILFDFALAHRLRTLSRSHLMGALTPLYLAWVASYAGEVTPMSDAQVEARLEQLAMAFEAGKPYLLSRWRWPDRFNP